VVSVSKVTACFISRLLSKFHHLFLSASSSSSSSSSSCSTTAMPSGIPLLNTAQHLLLLLPHSPLPVTPVPIAQWYATQKQSSKDEDNGIIASAALGRLAA
jgi:hypothetical protein